MARYREDGDFDDDMVGLRAGTSTLKIILIHVGHRAHVTVKYSACDLASINMAFCQYFSLNPTQNVLVLRTSLPSSLAIERITRIIVSVANQFTRLSTIVY